MYSEYDLLKKNDPIEYLFRQCGETIRGRDIENVYIVSDSITEADELIVTNQAGSVVNIPVADFIYSAGGWINILKRIRSTSYTLCSPIVEYFVFITEYREDENNVGEAVIAMNYKSLHAMLKHIYHNPYIFLFNDKAFYRALSQLNRII